MTSQAGAAAEPLSTIGPLIYLSDQVWQMGAAMFLHGIFVVHLFAPLHEGSHGTAFKSKWLNDGVYWFCALALGLSPLHFKLQHADHHAYTQDVDRDPQMITIGESWAPLPPAGPSAY